MVGGPDALDPIPGGKPESCEGVPTSSSPSTCDTWDSCEVEAEAVGAGRMGRGPGVEGLASDAGMEALRGTVALPIFGLNFF